MKKKIAAKKGIVNAVTDRRLDFTPGVPLRKSYIIASSARSGSNFLSSLLWHTGVLGAPCEYLNPNFEMHTMMNRLKASSPADYLARLLECRTSRNGIFGLKSHFHNFEAFLKGYPGFLKAIAPVAYVYISREDKVAQAVSMAKAYQTAAWTAAMKGNRRTPRYDRALITKCLEEIGQQELSWLKWFDAHDIEPFTVTYEDLAADPEAVVDDIVEFLGAENDTPEEVLAPEMAKQGDQSNVEWVEQFRRETGEGADLNQTVEDDGWPFPRARGAKSPGGAKSSGGAKPSRGSKSPARAVAHAPAGEHFFDRYTDFVKEAPGSSGSATGFIEAIRLRHRYDAIVGRNRDLFRDARVLDLGSGDGLWSMAALDAGASNVVALDGDAKRAAAAKKTLDAHGADPQSFRFVTSEVFPALRSFEPGEFDLILCKGFFEVSDPRQFFAHMHRLQPAHIVLDTAIVVGKGPISRYTLRLRDVSAPKATGRYATVMSLPNHDLITFFCDYYDFRWRLVDWQELGLTDWIGVQDYERDRRRTYVLERAD